MSSDGSSGDSDGEPSGIIASIVVVDPPASTRRQRSRLVRIGSTNDSVGPAFGAPGSITNTNTNTNSNSNNNSNNNSDAAPLPSQLSGASPLVSGSLYEAAVASTSLLQPHHHAAAERATGSLRGGQPPPAPSRRQHASCHPEGETSQSVPSGLRAQQAPSVVMMEPVDRKNESRAAPAVTRRLQGRDESVAERARASRSVSVPFTAGGGLGSRPSSPLRPGSNRGSVFGNLGASTSSAFGGTIGRKRSSELARSAQSSPNTNTNTAAAAAILFPTTEWIRAALGMDGAAAGADGGSAAAAGSGGEGAGGARGSVAGSPAPTTTAAPPAASNSGTGAAAPTATRDTAMLLHEQRVKAALRSQEEMRDFGVILRRLEEEGAQVLQEQRRRRQERHARQRGSVDGGQPRRHRGHARGKPPTTTTTTATAGAGTHRRTSGESEGSHAADEDASEGFSSSTDEEEEDSDVVGRAGQGGDASGDVGGVGRGATSKAAAEVQGASNMSRVALIKLRDRTAREWVVLQRRRLEQRRDGPAALHRHMQASQQRLQATRTGAGTEQGTSTHGSHGTLVVAATGEEADGGRLVLPPLPRMGGPSQHPAVDSSLAISWGEQRASLTAAAENSTTAVGEVADVPTSGVAALLPVVSADGVTSPPPSPCHGDDYPHPDTATSRGSVSSGCANTAAHPSLDDATPPRRDTGSDTASVDRLPIGGGLRSTALVCAPTDLGATMAGTGGEDERLRGELQRLLFQANECTLYGLDQCLNSRARTKTVAAASTKTLRQSPTNGVAKGSAWTPARLSHAANSRSALTGGLSEESSSHASSGMRSGASVSHLSAPLPAGDVRGPTLPLSLHRHFVQHSTSGAASVSRASVSGGYGGGSTQQASRSEAARETSRVGQASFVAAATAAGGTEDGAPRTPTATTTTTATSGTPLPPLGSTPERQLMSVTVISPSTTPTAKVTAEAAKRTGALSLPSVSPNRSPLEDRRRKDTAAAAPPCRFASLSNRKAHQRAPLPVERGVGEHAAALLQHEMLLTRRYEMEAERGNAREIDRACETLQQLFPLRRQLLEQDIQKSCAGVKARTTTTTTAATPLEGRASAASAAAGIATSTGSSPDAAVDRSYQPQSVLQRHRQLLFDEAVRLESVSRAAARDAYLDVLVQLAQRHVSSVSWPVVESMLAEARDQLRQEMEKSAAPTAAAAAAAAASESADVSTGGGDDDSGDGEGSNARRRAAASGVTVTSPPRDKIQHLIAAHLGVLELSQWPVQEVLHHLAALYRVPLYLLYEGIAEQQRRFAHTYNYEERFRAVDRRIGGGNGGSSGGAGGGAGVDSVLRLTLHRCRRPPLSLARGSATLSSGMAQVGGAGGTATTAAAAAADAALGAGGSDPSGGALFYIRLRIAQQSISSSAVPLSSAAASGSAGPHAPSLSSSSTAKLLSFMGQTLTLYLPTSGVAAARRRRSVSQAYSGRSHPRPGVDGGAGVAGEEEGGAMVSVELMQNGVSAPLARGAVDLEAMGLYSHAEGSRIHTQALQIALRRKGYRTAELKATLEVTF